MSTLDSADIDVMRATRTCAAAQRFQYDYLNDDITDDGRIDYSLTNKIPENLRTAIASGKKMLVLINPPYADAGNRDNLAVGDGEKTKLVLQRPNLDSPLWKVTDAQVMNYSSNLSLVFH